MSSVLATRIAALVVAFYALVLLGIVGPQQGWPGTGGKVERQTDYVAIWAGGELALEGRPAEAYNWESHRAAQEKLLGKPADAKLPWFYPPTFLLIASVMAILPYGLSMLVWVAATSAAYAVAAARIMGSWQGALWLCVPAAGFLNSMVGNNGLLSAALFGFGLAFLPVRPILAGICFGALTYKPHLGILVPVALVAAGQWRAIAAAAATAIALAALSVAAFGLAPWAEFLPAIAKASAQTAAMQAPEKLQTAFGMARSLGADPTTAYGVQIVVALIAGVVVGLVWRSERLGYDLKAALLAVAAVLASPYLFVYDLTILTLAQAFLFRAAGATGLDPIEIAGLAAANLAVLFFAATGVPLGFLASLIVMALVLRRAMPQLADAPGLSEIGHRPSALQA